MQEVLTIQRIFCNQKMRWIVSTSYGWSGRPGLGIRQQDARELRVALNSTATWPMRVTRALAVSRTSSAISASRAARSAGLDADLDQFVVGQRAPGFIEHASGQAIVADADHGLQGMGAAAQEAHCLSDRRITL